MPVDWVFSQDIFLADPIELGAGDVLFCAMHHHGVCAVTVQDAVGIALNGYIAAE